MPYVLSVSDVVPMGMFDSIFPILQMGGVALGLILMVVGAFRQSTPATDPLQTLTTAGHQSLIDPGDLTDLEHDLTDDEIWAMVYDSEFRMLEPYEVKRGMAFPGEYILLGNKREQVRMAGNAVTPNAARDLIAACVESLGSTVRRHYDLVA